MTDEAITRGEQIPSVASSAAGRLALKRASLSVGAAVIGAYGLGAVLTYSPEDPSLNVATDGPTHNLFGGPGAMVADIAIQTLGAAAPLAMGALMAAGALRIYRKQLVARIDKRRVIAALGGVTLLAAAAATIPTPEGWPLMTGFGGMLGDGVSSMIAGLASWPGLPFPILLTGVLCAIGGLLASGWAFQVRAADVKIATHAVQRAAVTGAGAAHRAIGYVSEKTRRETREEAQQPALAPPRAERRQQPQQRPPQRAAMPPTRPADS
ncbi:MAG: DNA translocase FtsK 4TM domain-containing protein, partial [Hyphomonadaceae bacterium]|nr:DNA translocase FtsK 4TM domain-containing protein [Hyphomonadaceae bacterium]